MRSIDLKRDDLEFFKEKCFDLCFEESNVSYWIGKSENDILGRRNSFE